MKNLPWIIVGIVVAAAGIFWWTHRDGGPEQRAKDESFRRTQDSLRDERLLSIARGDSIQWLVDSAALYYQLWQLNQPSISDLQRENDRMLDTAGLGTIRALGLQEPSRFKVEP